MRPRLVLEAVGVSLLLIPSYYLPLLSNLQIYHHGLPITHLLQALLIVLLCLAILVLASLQLIERLPQRLRRVILAAFAGLMLWRASDILIGFWTEPPAHSFISQALWVETRKYVCLAVLVGSCICADLFPRSTEKGTRALRVLVAAFGCFAFWCVPRLVHLGLIVPQRPSSDVQFRNASMPSNRAPRIVWILFDELSYDQTFDHPQDSVRLQSFLRLRDESVSFSHVEAAGFYTELIIPSLFLGRRLDQIQSTDGTDLLYKDGTRKHWVAYDPKATLFGLAQSYQWPTGITGFYNPYCQILVPMASDCFWEPTNILPMERYGASESKSALANVAVIPSQILGNFAHHDEAFEEEHVRGYRSALTHAQDMIGNPQLRFVFIHLPIPHPFGIYDRKNHRLRSGGTYLDNLVLADDTLDTLMQQIDATPSADRTIVIISSDHSWRIPIWRAMPEWTQEEERASRGQFDERPVLLIHFPGETAGREINKDVPELMEHDMIAAMLRGDIKGPENLTEFVTK